MLVLNCLLLHQNLFCVVDRGGHVVNHQVCQQLIPLSVVVRLDFHIVVFESPQEILIVVAINFCFFVDTFLDLNINDASGR